ncbi:OmpA family protein [Nocardiopsis sp. CNT312]|uniref:OmpA family protein n=1 Tax=Nocardiopsis sp. CNT312 TaxID=1137268 RepID=UPI001E29AC33|nr:OmpA family protein [Nocardiopsis sp. CNT312]
MNSTHGKPRPGIFRIIPLGAPIISITLITSGCVASPDDTNQTEHPPGEETSPTDQHPTSSGSIQNEPLARSHTSSTEIGDDLQINVISFERLKNEILRLRLDIKNSSSENFLLHDGLAENGEFYTSGGVTLIDTENQKRYLSYDESDGSCLCQPLESEISSGSTESIWVAFPAPPSDIEQMTVVTPLTPPMFDIPITDSSEELEHGELAEPVILDLTLISDDLEDNTGRTENEDEVSIILSSDVLFSTGSSELTPEAESILEQVAVEISDASSTLVNVDGYTDNTGSDSINGPLSLERAESVESTLSKLTTRENVSFDIEGHGAANPIGDNSTEEGRERNRRVTITFEK